MQNKKQHYLPVAYLQFFSTKQDHVGRSSFVWRFDGEQTGKVTVGSQCRRSYFYTATRPELEQLTFNEAERDWPNLVRKLQDGASGLPERDYKLAIIQLVILFLRNRTVENETNMSRLEAFERDLPPLLLHVFGSSTDAPIQTRDELSRAIWASLQSWGLQPIIASSRSFITSDNPTLLFYVEDNVDLIAAPISPAIYLLAYRTRFLSAASAVASHEDVGVLNLFQARNSVAQIYSSRSLSDDQKSSLSAAFKIRQPLGAHTLDGLEISAYDYHPQTRKIRFSFLMDRGS